MLWDAGVCDGAAVAAWAEVAGIRGRRARARTAGRVRAGFFTVTSLGEVSG